MENNLSHTFGVHPCAYGIGAQTQFGMTQPVIAGFGSTSINQNKTQLYSSNSQPNMGINRQLNNAPAGTGLFGTTNNDTRFGNTYQNSGAQSFIFPATCGGAFGQQTNISKSSGLYGSRQTSTFGNTSSSTQCGYPSTNQGQNQFQGSTFGISNPITKTSGASSFGNTPSYQNTGAQFGGTSTNQGTKQFQDSTFGWGNQNITSSRTFGAPASNMHNQFGRLSSFGRPHQQSSSNMHILACDIDISRSAGNTHVHITSCNMPNVQSCMHTNNNCRANSMPAHTCNFNASNLCWNKCNPVGGMRISITACAMYVSISACNSSEHALLWDHPNKFWVHLNQNTLSNPTNYGFFHYRPDNSDTTCNLSGSHFDLLACNMQISLAPPKKQTFTVDASSSGTCLINGTNIHTCTTNSQNVRFVCGPPYMIYPCRLNLGANNVPLNRNSKNAPQGLQSTNNLIFGTDANSSSASIGLKFSNFGCNTSKDVMNNNSAMSSNEIKFGNSVSPDINSTSTFGSIVSNTDDVKSHVYSSHNMFNMKNEVTNSSHTDIKFGIPKTLSTSDSPQSAQLPANKVPNPFARVENKSEVQQPTNKVIHFGIKTKDNYQAKSLFNFSSFPNAGLNTGKMTLFATSTSKIENPITNNELNNPVISTENNNSTSESSVITSNTGEFKGDIISEKKDNEANSTSNESKFKTPPSSSEMSDSTQLSDTNDDRTLPDMLDGVKKNDDLIITPNKTSISDSVGTDSNTEGDDAAKIL